VRVGELRIASPRFGRGENTSDEGCGTSRADRGGAFSWPWSVGEVTAHLMILLDIACGLRTSPWPGAMGEVVGEF
jgi:hypothetical protein